MSAPLISGVVVHWHAERELAQLAAAWPADPLFELIVIDNGSEAPLAVGRARLVTPGGNLGFAGAVNLGLREARAPWVLVLNPDARPEPGALEALAEGVRRHPQAAGLAPRLVGPNGASQHEWQLRPLPSLGQLLRQAFFLPGPRGPRTDPSPGTAVAQPAAAALLLDRRRALDLGGFDERFFPAWFEDVDYARRLADSGGTLLYWPAATFHHGLGQSVGALGYGGFLRAYARGLHRYVGKHHGRAAAGALRLLVPLGAILRILALPLRRPRRARSRGEAAAALVALFGDAVRGFPDPAR